MENTWLGQAVSGLVFSKLFSKVILEVSNFTQRSIYTQSNNYDGAFLQK